MTQETQQPLQDPAGGKVRFADADARSLLARHLDELAAPGMDQWRTVKANSSRTVYCGSIDGQEIYLKHFHSRLLAHRLGRCVGSSDARREMRFMQYLSSRGVRTAPALAATCHDGVEWLATRAVAPAVQGDLWHLQQLQAGAAGQRPIRQATIALAEMIGRMHAAGVVHRDLHCGNILVRTQEPLELVLTDLHRVRHRRRLGRRTRAWNLAQLLHDRYDFTTRTDRVRFLKHYLIASGAGGSLRGWGLMIDDFARRHSRRQYAHLDRRVMGTNKYFSPVKFPGGWHGFVVLASKWQVPGSRAAEMELTVDQWKEALGNPDALFENPTQVIKDSKTSLVVCRQIQVGPHTLDVYIKRSRRKNPWKVLLDCFRPGRAVRAFRHGHAILSRRVVTALPLAALERRRGPVLLDSILITEAVPAPTLHHFLTSTLARGGKDQPPLTPQGQRAMAGQVLWQLGRMVQKLHDNNFAHRDLKAQNILVRTEGTAQVVLIDLDGLSQRRRLSPHRRFQGLMRLNVSLLNCPVVTHAGRLRMLLGYLRRPGCGRINFKPYWRVLEKWSARKLNQQIRARRKRQKEARKPNG